MSLYALVQTHREGIPAARLSCANLLRAFRRMLRDYLHPAERGRTLCDRLRSATIDAYSRKDRTSRSYPRKKQESPPGTPRISRATPSQIRAAQSLRAAA